MAKLDSVEMCLSFLRRINIQHSLFSLWWVTRPWKPAGVQHCGDVVLDRLAHYWVRWASGSAIYRILRLLPSESSINAKMMTMMMLTQNKHSVSSWYFPDDPEFTELIRQAELAVDDGVFPQRIYQVAQNKFIQQERKVFLQAFPIVLLRFRAQAGATLWRTGRVWPLGCSSQKTKSLMGGSIPSGQNGCTACVVHVVLAGSQIIITRWAYILINA